MLVQKSFKNELNTVYLIPTPIGNLGDMTYRSVMVLKEELDILLCEDTRVTGKLLNKFEIKLNLMAYHEHNKEKMIPKILELIKEGKKLGLVSDAGMPGISDPGFEIVKMCDENNINCVVLPGASAFVLGIVRSNFNTTEFRYAGFLKGSKNEKTKKLENLLNSDCPSVIYESTHKIIRTLEVINELSPNTIVCVGRELTKINEEFIRGTSSELIEFYQENSHKGEFVLVIDAKIQKDFSEISIADEYEALSKQNMSKKNIIKTIAKNRGLAKNDVYMMFIEKE